MALVLAGTAWAVVLVLLVVMIVHLELEAATPLTQVTLVLAGAAALAAVASSVFAFRALRRYRFSERELRRTEGTFRGILTIAADAIISVDRDLRIVHYNNGAEAVFGWPAAEIIGQPLDLLLPERYRGIHARHVHAFGDGPDVARRMGERRQIFGLRRDGSEFPAEASIARLETDGVRLYNVVLRDITQRVRSEQAQRFLAAASNDLNASLDYEQTLVAACHVPVPYLCDCAVLDVLEPSGEMRRLSSVHEDTENTRLLRRLAGRSPAPTDWPFPVAQVMREGRAQVHRHPRAGPATTGVLEAEPGATIEALGVCSSLTIPLRARGRIFGALTLLATEPTRTCDEDTVALAADLGERVAAAIDNAALYRDERRASQMRDELLGVVSHDLRNPLSAIRMCGRVLAEHEPALASDRRDMAQAIMESVRTMERLIQDLLDAATIESGHLRISTEQGSIVPVVHRAITMVQDAAKDRGVSLTSDLDELVPDVALDAVRMEQVVANLLANAVKFTERDGSVMVRVRHEGAFVTISVDDTGIGIPAEALPHIFDRFWHAHRSARTAGTGLGLAIAKGIVHAHAGKLTVRSTVGVGSSFTVSLQAGSPKGPSLTIPGASREGESHEGASAGAVTGLASHAET